MSQSFKLFRLQQIDNQLDRGRARLREIETALSENSALLLANAQYEAANNLLKERTRLLRRAEDDVNSQRIKIEQTEATLYGGKVRNPKELQDLQNEAVSLKKYLSVLEDRQIEAMVVLEESEDQTRETFTNLERVRQQVAENNSHLTAEQSVLLSDVHRQESERQATSGGLLAEDIRLYEGLRLSRNGVAVAKVTDRACSACGSTLSAALLVSARSPNQITRCATCSRVLYAV